MTRAAMVVDAGAVVAALTSTDADGSWALEQLAAGDLVAPELMPYEAANILRRLELGGVLDATAASLAHSDMLELSVELHPWRTVADRAWALRGAVTAYDAAYVALAEALGVPLLTFDRRLARAPGPTCAFLLPPK